MRASRCLHGASTLSRFEFIVYINILKGAFLHERVASFAKKMAAALLRLCDLLRQTVTERLYTRDAPAGAFMQR